MRKSPQRSCIGCRAVRGKQTLVRVVRTPGGEFLLDPTGKMAGRGAYVCPSAVCFANAVKRKSFDRALRAPVPKEAGVALEHAFIEYVRAQMDASSREE